MVPAALWVLTALACGTLPVAAADPGPPDAPPVGRLDGCGGHSAQFSDDGRRLLTAGPGGARVWDVATLKPLGDPFPAPAPAAVDTPAVDLSADGNRVLVHLQDEARVYDVATGKVTLTLRHAPPPGPAAATDGRGDHPEQRRILSARFAARAARIVTAGGDKTTRIWDTATGAELRRFAHDRPVGFAVLSPDGRTLVTVGRETRTWDAETGRPRLPEPLDGEHQPPAFSGDWRHIATREAGSVQVYELATGRPVPVRAGGRKGNEPVDLVALSRDGRQLLTVIRSEAYLWPLPRPDGDDVTDGFALAYRRSLGYVTFAAFSPDGTRVLTCSRTAVGDGKADMTAVWDTATRQRVVAVRGVGWAAAGAWSPDGRLVAVTCRTRGGGDGFTLICRAAP